MGTSTSTIRAAIQGLLNENEALSADQIEAMLLAGGLNVNYSQVNRALNSAYNPALGETPFARTDGEDESRWVYFAVTPESPVTQREFTIKTATALTQLAKTRDNLLAPAIKAGAVAVGDNDALDVSLGFLNNSITALEMARNAGDAKAAVIYGKKENEAERIALEAERAAVEAEFARRERELAIKEKALLKSSAAKKPALKRK